MLAKRKKRTDDFDLKDRTFPREIIEELKLTRKTVHTINTLIKDVLKESKPRYRGDFKDMLIMLSEALPVYFARAVQTVRKVVRDKGPSFGNAYVTGIRNLMGNGNYCPRKTEAYFEDCEKRDDGEYAYERLIRASEAKSLEEVTKGGDRYKAAVSNSSLRIRPSRSRRVIRKRLPK